MVSLLVQVCIPGLHISLGIYDRLWELLEDACNELDLLLAKQSSGMDGNTFDRYCKALKESAALRLKLRSQQMHAEVLGNHTTFLMFNLPDPSNDPVLLHLRKEESSVLQEISATVKRTQYVLFY